MYQVLLIFLIFAIGCGTVSHGTWQDIPISSTPQDAMVTVDGELKGRTPLVVKLKRKTMEYAVNIEKDGYERASISIVRRTSASVSIANTFLFPGISTLVDMSTGGKYILDPQWIVIKLVPLADKNYKEN